MLEALLGTEGATLVSDQACKPSSVSCSSSACAGRQSSLWDGSCLASLAIYPRVTERAAPVVAQATPPSVRSCSRWGLPSRDSHLPRWWSLTPPFHYDLAADVRPEATCFLLHYSVGSPRLGVAQHRALRSSDFPRATHDGPRLPSLVGHRPYYSTIQGSWQKPKDLRGFANLGGL